MFSCVWRWLALLDLPRLPKLFLDHWLCKGVRFDRERVCVVVCCIAENSLCSFENFSNMFVAYGLIPFPLTTSQFGVLQITGYLRPKPWPVRKGSPLETVLLLKLGPGPYEGFRSLLKLRTHSGYLPYVYGGGNLARSRFRRPRAQ